MVKRLAPPPAQYLTRQEPLKAPIVKEPKITYLFEGVYGVSIKHSNDSVAFFYDWSYLNRPYLGKVWKIKKHGYFSLVAFSGTPPMGQVLMIKLKPDVGERLQRKQQLEEADLIKNNIPHPLIIL